MENTKKYLEGELRYVEGKTTIKDLLKTLAGQLVTQKWIEYKNTETGNVWHFDLRREIWLPSAFKAENIKLYKAVIQEDGTYKKGTEVPASEYSIVNYIIKGINTSDNTKIGDRVLIDVCYEAEEFQRVSFIKELLPSGEEKAVAKLKSRPQGSIKIYEDTIVQYTKEPLHQKGGNSFYEVPKTPISNSPTHDIVVYRNDLKVDASEYVVDYWNGLVMFHQTQNDLDVITADYGYRSGLRKSEISATKYSIYEDRIIDQTGTNELLGKDIIVDVDFYWGLQYPATVEEIKDRAILKTEVDISASKDRKELKTYYWEIKYVDHLNNESGKYRTGFLCRFGSTLDTTLPEAPTLDGKLSSEWAKWAWYRESCFEDDGIVFEDWLPVRYYLNMTTEYVNIVLQGDPSPDINPYRNYLISYAYIGMLKGYENAEHLDLENNFAMTVGGDIVPQEESEFATTWGLRTGTGVTDIVMERTDSNIPYQAHHASFYTSPEFMDKHFISTSEFTGSHHFSEVTVTHAYERERGKLQGMLIGDRSSIFHLDELISDKDDFDYRGALINNRNEFKTDCGSPFTSKEKKWVMFNINAPYWFANNSGNVHYGVIIRKA